MSDANNILNNREGNLSEDKLAAYLEGRLSVDEQREVEEWLAQEGMESDAVDGLMTVSADDTKKLAERINYRLQYDMKKQGNRRKKLYRDDKWGWIAIMVVLLLVILGYIVFKMMG